MEVAHYGTMGSYRDCRDFHARESPLSEVLLHAYSLPNQQFTYIQEYNSLLYSQCSHIILCIRV